ncbi:hypothetical protein DFH27DRAFT_528648 [Peziza echinospora]|nr:hypothetical protein DFH27DRAFT_528648 [Peziza echinospora]
MTPPPPATRNAWFSAHGRQVFPLRALRALERHGIFTYTLPLQQHPSLQFGATCAIATWIGVWKLPEFASITVGLWRHLYFRIGARGGRRLFVWRSAPAHSDTPASVADACSK